MHVTFLGHAGLLVEAAGQRIVLDPWFAEPVFARAWWRYPPPPFPDAGSLSRIDVLALSHTHPDHSGPGTLAQIDPATPICILPFPSGHMERRLEQAGLRRVLRFEAWQRREMAPGLALAFVPHHQGWEVASIVVEADGRRLYHGNDNTLSLEVYREIASRFGPIDVAFLPFAGASSYPTCFEWDRATIESKGLEKKAEGIARFTDAIEGLRPALAVPFASSWALLEPDQLWKNYLDRPTPHEALEAARPLTERSGTALLVLEPGDEWSPEAGVLRRGRAAGWTTSATDVARYAGQRRQQVAAAAQERCADDGAIEAGWLDRAFRLHFAEMLARTREPVAELDMTAAFVAEGPGGGAWHLVFRPGLPPELRAGEAAEADVRLALGAAEFWSVLAGGQTWEDPWYGYRLRVRQRQDAPYWRAFWEMLLNADGESITAAVLARLHQI